MLVLSDYEYYLRILLTYFAMQAATVRLFQDPNSSFIFHHETRDFDKYHHHPEYELVLILKGRGIRFVGDAIHRFKENDLVFLGSDLPHVWRCDEAYFSPQGDFTGEGLVIQFAEDFLGEGFFDIPEYKNLKKFMAQSSQGCRLFGNTQQEIIQRMVAMMDMNPAQRLLALFSILDKLSTTRDYDLICSPTFLEPYKARDNEPLRAVIQHTLQHYKEDIKIKDVTEIANMSSTQFFITFKKTYKMSFKSYLLKIRIGCACRLLAEERVNISQAAFESGFENLSNFNRQFKNIKGMTPSAYLRLVNHKTSLAT